MAPMARVLASLVARDATSALTTQPALIAEWDTTMLEGFARRTAREGVQLVTAPIAPSASQPKPATL